MLREDFEGMKRAMPVLVRMRLTDWGGGGAAGASELIRIEDGHDCLSMEGIQWRGCAVIALGL